MKIILTLIVFAFAWPLAVAAQTAVNPALSFLQAADGAQFQILASDGVVDMGATSQALQAYLATHPQPTAGGPTLVSKLNFIRLLTGAEQSAFVVAQAQANALTAAQMASPTSSQQALIGLQAFMMQYNAMQPGDTINLADPNTIAQINLFLTLGIVQTQARVSAILAGQAPPS